MKLEVLIFFYAFENIAMIDHGKHVCRQNDNVCFSHFRLGPMAVPAKCTVRMGPTTMRLTHLASTPPTITHTTVTVMPTVARGRHPRPHTWPSRPGCRSRTWTAPHHPLRSRSTRVAVMGTRTRIPTPTPTHTKVSLHISYTVKSLI